MDVTVFSAEATSDLGIAVFEDVTIVDAAPVPVRPANRWQRAALRVAAGVVKALLAVKRAVTRLTDPALRVRAAAELRRTYRAFIHPYQPQHKAGRYWYGRQRSTSEVNMARAASSRAAAKEGELPRYPDEFVSWLANFCETLRAEQDALHPHVEGQHFVCS